VETIKPAADLRNVSNRDIVVTIEAFDEQGNSCGPQSLTVSVIGILDECRDQFLGQYIDRYAALAKGYYSKAALACVIRGIAEGDAGCLVLVD
jgi:hypothetical protein